VKKPSDIMGAFHSSKNSRIFVKGANSVEISLISVWKIPKLLNFKMQTIQLKISEITGGNPNGMKISGKKF